jgi:autotransporter translocation and assembly factor TamB
MLFKSRLLLAGLFLLVAALLAVWFTPTTVSHGVRWWIWWRARQEGFTVNIDKIDAPFLRPVAIHQLRLKNERDDTLRVDLTITDVTFDLDFKHILLHRRGRAIRNLSIRQLHGELRRTNPTVRAITRRGWATLHRMLPENLTVADSELRIENGPTLVLLRNGFLSANQTEAGRFRAAEVMIASPWFHQTFSQLRGATHWEADHLTIAGLTLTHGLDLQSATADLSRLGNQRVGLQFDADAFGGKIRGNISHEWRSQQSNWKIAGGATDISLEQTSEAFGFADRVSGLLHAGNFTFRGNLAEPDRVTASLWSELTGLTWRNRTAEAIMIGAALYNRRIQLQQLYIRQRANQFTLSGEAAFPSSASGWLSPDFRGNISASIDQLGDFAALFGANAGDFAGKITIDGAMDTRDRKFGGHLMVEGASLTFFKTAIDNLSAKLNLKATHLEIEQLAMTRKNDSLSGQGKIDLSHEHDYSGTLEARLNNVLDYLSVPRGPTEKTNPIPADVQANIDSSKWDVRGVIHSPNSSPISFTANFPLRIGTDWNAFRVSPLNITLNFQSIFLAKAPQLFHPQIFSDGILSANISLSETLQHPRIDGDIQLMNGKLFGDGRAPINLTEASGRVVFGGNRASIEFLNVATKDTDISIRGEIDFQDTNNVTVRIDGAMPIFDLTPHPIDCMSKIEFASVPFTLAPAVAELQFCGALFQPNWTIGLKERTIAESSDIPDANGVTREFPLCFSNSSLEKATLLLGALPRAEAQAAATPLPKKRRTGRD